MDSTIRRTLWGAFAVLTLLVAIGLAITLIILQSGKRQEYRIVHTSEPFLDAAQSMDEDAVQMLAATRGYMLTSQTQFLEQYDDAIRDFGKQSVAATQLATSSQDAQLVGAFRRQFGDLKALSDE